MRTAIYLSALLVYWIVAAAVLWWSYSISAFIRGGHYQQSQAMWLVCEMAVIVPFLTCIGWLFVKPHRFHSAWSLALAAGCRIPLLLVLYAAAILANIQFGNYDVPLPPARYILSNIKSAMD